MAERAPNEVWIDPVGKTHAYIRIGPKDNLATVNFPGDSQEAEAVRLAFERLFATRANGNHKPISEEKS